MFFLQLYATLGFISSVCSLISLSDARDSDLKSTVHGSDSGDDLVAPSEDVNLFPRPTPKPHST